MSTRFAAGRILFRAVTPLLISASCMLAGALPGQATPPVPAALAAVPAQTQPKIMALANNDPQRATALATAFLGLQTSGLATDPVAALTRINNLAGMHTDRLPALAKKYTELRSQGLDENAAWDKVATFSDGQQAQETLDQTNSATKDFIGIKWGLGVALTSSFGHRDRVTSASVDPNGIVRVSQTTNQQPRILLELHYFFDRPPGDNTPQTQGHGPWVGLQSSSAQVIDSIAFGYMFGWRHDATKSSSFNLGVGFIVDAKVQVLGDGVTANAKLPGGGSTVPLKNESRVGAILAASFSF